MASSSPSPAPATARAAVQEFVRREVADWDDEVTATTRFKAFSGQRADWEPQFLFWRNLILKVARHLGLLIIRSSEVKNVWFYRGGLTPLCIDRVLQEMYTNRDILLRRDMIDPTSGLLYRVLRKMGLVLGASRSSSVFDASEECFILKPLLQELASDVIKKLSENHWTSTCIITMSKFQNICKGSNEASVILSYLFECGKAQYISIRKGDMIEGVKVSLGPLYLPSVSSLDHDVLHLIWTTEKLQQQVDVLDHRWGSYKKLALAASKLGNKEAAYRHIRQCKLLSESRARCTTLLDRVEEVLGIISNAECTKKVSDAIKVGNRAIKDQNISVEEVHLHLQELDEHLLAQKQVNEALESMPLQSLDADDEDIEEEFKKLEMETSDETVKMPQIQDALVQSLKEESAQENAESLSESLSKISISAV